MKSARPLALLAALALAGCGSSEVRYNNSNYPSAGQAQFDSDRYECERDSEHPAAPAADGSVPAGMVIDPAQVEACLAGMGWQRSN